MVEISVIYYIYNNPILKDSLHSILTQTFEDIEVICINNVLTDDTIEILKEYEEDKRLIIHPMEHNCFADSVNNILKHVQGKYVYIANVGCVLNNNTLEELYEKAEKNNSDLTVGDMHYLNKAMGEFYEKKCFIDVYEDSFTYEKISNLIDIDVSTENKLYLNSFIKDNDLKMEFDEKSFVYDSVFKAKKIAYVHKVLGVHDDLFTISTKKNDSRLLSIIPFSNRLLDLFNETNVMDDYKTRIYNHKMYIMIEGLKKIQEKYKEEYFDNLRFDLKNIMLNNQLNKDFLDNISTYYRKVFELVLISESYYEYELLKKTYLEMDDYYNLLVDRNYYKKSEEKE